jgi:uncharacterized membrane protein
VAKLEPSNRNRSRERVAVMIGAGVIAAVIDGLLHSWWYAPVAGWVVSCAVYVAWVWLRIGRLDAAVTQQHARREDPGRTVSDLLVVLIAIASLGAVVVLLVHTSKSHGADKVIGAVMALASVALSWTMLHTLYTLRYARLYYEDPVGGIDFNTSEDPCYTDFAYLAFDLGMTFQVADTNVHTTRLRGVILRHTLLSYVFGTVILATTVNLVVGLT